MPEFTFPINKAVKVKASMYSTLDPSRISEFTKIFHTI
jgi:hypothetical protein